MTCGVYAIKNIKRDKWYVGSGVIIENRWNAHRHSLRKGNHRNAHLQRAWNSDGEESFEFFVLEECEPSQLLEVEQSWLPEERTVQALKDNGYYNLCPLALGYPGNTNNKGKIFSEESRKRNSEAQKLRWQTYEMTEDNRRKLSEKAKLQHKKGLVTEEVRKKMSDAKKANWEKFKNEEHDASYFFDKRLKKK